MTDLGVLTGSQAGGLALPPVHRPDVAVVIIGPDPTDAALRAAAAAADARHGGVHVIRCISLDRSASRGLCETVTRHARIQLRRVARRCAQLHPEVPVTEQLHVGSADTCLQTSVGLVVSADHAVRARLSPMPGGVRLRTPQPAFDAPFPASPGARSHSS